MTPTKICPQCGIEKPAAKLYTNGKTEDGLSRLCRQCSATNRKPRTAGGINPALAEFQPRELIAELRARGYKGELTYVHTIKL